MKAVKAQTSANAPVPGPDARCEYRKLPRDLAALTRSFGIVLPPQLERDAAALAFAIECADRLLDAIPEPDGRARLGRDILLCLQGEMESGNELTPELAGWLARLCEIAERHRVREQFRRIISRLLTNSERMRTTRHRIRFLAGALREGRLMVELLLLILGDVSTPQFNAFMRRLSGAANLGDKLRDARCDFQRGEMAVKPNLLFRAWLSYELARRTLGLVYSSVTNWRLVMWGTQSLFTELIWFRFSKFHSH
jgi:hypothetical protein